MRLVIAEKPSVAKAIANVIGASKHNDGYLSGDGYAVSWCFGHLAELAQAESYEEKYSKWSYEDLPIVPEVWQYVVSEDKRKQFETLKKLMHDENVTEVINACDAGREGELIFRMVYNIAECIKPMKRLWNEVTGRAYRGDSLSGTRTVPDKLSPRYGIRMEERECRDRRE